MDSKLNDLIQLRQYLSQAINNQYLPTADIKIMIKMLNLLDNKIIKILHQTEFDEMFDRKPGLKKISP
jgi:hypothetical protein